MVTNGPKAAAGTVDICVLGGGPSGSLTALRLAELGFDVCLLERRVDDPNHIYESLAIGAIQLLDFIGIQEQLTSSTCARLDRSFVKWGSDEFVQNMWAENGLLVNRGVFDAVLRTAARERKVKVIQPARCVAIEPTSSGHWNIKVVNNGETFSLLCGYLVDASGRNSLIRQPLTRTGRKTFAIRGTWRSAQGLTCPNMFVEAFDDWWVWLASSGNGIVHGSVFLDPVRLRQRDSTSISSFFVSLVNQSRMLQPFLGEGLIHYLTVCDASGYLCEQAIGTNWIKVGSAAASFDPVSSHGICMAIRNALQAAIVINTQLRKPENNSVAQGFYRQRLGESSHRIHQTSVRFYHEQASHCPTGFWIDRSKGLETTDSRHATNIGSNPCSRETRLCLSTETELANEPVIERDFILVRPSLTHPSLDRPIAFLGESIPVSILVADLEFPKLSGEILILWANRYGEQTARELLSWFWRNELLTAAG